MPELIAKSALGGRNLKVGSVTLAEVEAGPITSIAAFPTKGASLAKGLKFIGLAMPAPNSFVESQGARLVWSGRDQAFLIGVAAPALDGAALTDQTDAWTVLSVKGAGAEDVLARLMPVDLRLVAFPVKAVLRTQVNHMNAVILRPDMSEIQIMVFRSMAETAWHEIADAMHMVAARSEAKI